MGQKEEKTPGEARANITHGTIKQRVQAAEMKPEIFTVKWENWQQVQAIRKQRNFNAGD